MEYLGIGENLLFEEFVGNIQTVKTQYEVILSSFSYLDMKEKTRFIKNTKSRIYSLPFRENKKNKIWEYLNGYITIEVLEEIVEGEKNKCKK